MTGVGKYRQWIVRPHPHGSKDSFRFFKLKRQVLEITGKYKATLVNSALPFDKHQWWLLNLTVLLNGPRGHWLAVVGKDAESHLRKDITCPTRALQELQSTLFSWPSLHSSQRTYTMPVSWSKKYKPRYFPHTQSQLPTGRQSLRTVSHERRQELSPCSHLRAPEHFWVFYGLGWALRNLPWNKGKERLAQCRPI